MDLSSLRPTSVGVGNDDKFGQEIKFEVGKLTLCLNLDPACWAKTDPNTGRIKDPLGGLSQILVSLNDSCIPFSFCCLDLLRSLDYVSVSCLSFDESSSNFIEYSSKLHGGH